MRTKVPPIVQIQWYFISIPTNIIGTAPWPIVLLTNITGSSSQWINFSGCKWELSSHVHIVDMRGQLATPKPPYNNFLASTPNNSFSLGTQSQGYYSSTNMNDVLSHKSPSFPKNTYWPTKISYHENNCWHCMVIWNNHKNSWKLAAICTKLYNRNWKDFG